jgi:hypothetical protein
MDPDPGGPKTCGSGESGFGSATLPVAIDILYHAFNLLGYNCSAVFVDGKNMIRQGDTHLVSFCPSGLPVNDCFQYKPLLPNNRLFLALGYTVQNSR